MIGWLILIGATLSEFFSRFWQMKQETFLSGVDAYYYALQIKFFAQTGAFKISESSPLLPLMGWTAKLGCSYEDTILLWAVFIQFGCAINILIADRLIHGKNRASLLPLLFSWVMLSPALTYIGIEFPKYAFSLMFLPFWPVGLVNRRLWPFSVAGIILSSISHLTMIGLFFVVLAGFIIMKVPRLKLGHWQKPMVFGVIVGLLLIVGLILGKFILIADFQRIGLRGLQPGLWTFFHRPELPRLLKAEVLVCAVISFILLIVALRNNTPNITRFWSPFIIFLLFVPLGSQEIMGIPERLSLTLPYLTLCLLMDLRVRFPTFIEKVAYCLVGLAVFTVALFPKPYLNLIHPARLNPDYPIYDQVTKAIAPQDISMLIAHQGLNYFYKYKTMKESFPYEPESHWPKAKIWRIVYGVTPSQWAYYLPERQLWGSGLLFDLSGPYSLIREDCWNEFRNKVKLGSDDELKSLVFDCWRNPSQLRPEFARQRAKQDRGEFSAYPVK
jgi:hypothetical protein